MLSPGNFKVPLALTAKKKRIEAKLEKLKNDICLLLFFAIPAQENRTDDAESRLINHLMKNYEIKRQILPTNNRSKAVVVTFDMAFSLLVDLVSRVGLLTQSRYD